MYYVIAKNSENKKTYVSKFKEKREAVSNIAFRFKKKLNSLNSSKHDIKNVETCWDCDEIYEELLDQNYDQLSESKKVKIMYDLFNYEQETYARQDISWQIIFANRGPDSDLYDFVLDSRYKFECNIPESRPSNNIVLPNAARILFEDIGVEYDLRIEKGVDRSCIYKIKKNENGDGFERDCNIHCSHDVHFEYPDWKAYLESVMCKTLIEMHHLKISFNENDVEDMFSRIIGMRFSTIAMIEKWIFEKLQVTKKSLPNFVLQESEINDEILFGNADVDFVLDGTFGKGVLKKQHYDFSISYLKTNDHQMFITDAHWN